MVNFITYLCVQLSSGISWVNVSIYRKLFFSVESRVLRTCLHLFHFLVSVFLCFNYVFWHSKLNKMLEKTVNYVTCRTWHTIVLWNLTLTEQRRGLYETSMLILIIILCNNKPSDVDITKDYNISMKLNKKCSILWPTQETPFSIVRLREKLFVWKCVKCMLFIPLP